MSDEIDLHVYLAALRKRWWLIVLCVVVALAATFALNAAQPKHYQATSTLLAVSPRYQWRFDAGILPLIDSRRDYQREFLAISRSNRIAEAASQSLQASGAVPGATPADLLSAINVRTGDGSTLLVTATAGDPQQAAAIANAWSDAFVQVARDVNGVSSDLANFQDELDRAGQRLSDLENQVAAVRSETGLYASGDSPDERQTFNLRQRQLDLRNETLAEYRNDLESLRYLATQLQNAPEGTDLAQLPWELLDGPVLSQRGVVSRQIALDTLDDPAALQALLLGEEASLSTTAGELAQEVDATQQELAADWQAYGAVNREYNLARETYNLLSRKVDEASIQERIDPSQLILVSEAVPPTSPVQTRQLAQLAVAGVIGLIVGVLIALWLELRKPRQDGAKPAAS
jgi:uncharacterized protein involved in exopolysaccharide biosynthesis